MPIESTSQRQYKPIRGVWVVILGIFAVDVLIGIVALLMFSEEVVRDLTLNLVRNPQYLVKMCWLSLGLIGYSVIPKVLEVFVIDGLVLWFSFLSPKT